MNLNQAAHGDREFGYIQTRLGVARKIVAGHVSDPVVAARVEAWTRAARGWQAARSLRMARFGDNMRGVAVTEGDKVEAERVFGFSVNTWGVNDLVAVVDAVPDADVDALVAEYDDSYEVVPELRAGGERRESLRYGARQELGLRSSSTTAASPRSPRTSRTSAACASCPASPSSASWRTATGSAGRGTGRPSALLRVLKVMAAGPAGGTSFMEDYTYHLGPGRAEDPRRAHARGLPDHHATVPAVRSIRSGSATGRTRSGWCSRRRPARVSSWASRTPGTVSASPRTRSRSSSPTSRCPAACRAGRLEAGARPVDLHRELAAGRRAAPHRPVHRGRPRGAGGLRPYRRHRAARHRRGHHRRGSSRRSSAGTRPTTGSRRGCESGDRPLMPRAGSRP